MPSTPDPFGHTPLRRVRTLARTVAKAGAKVGAPVQLDTVALILAIWLAAVTFGALIERAPPPPPEDDSIGMGQENSGAIWVPAPSPRAASPFAPIGLAARAPTRP